MGEMPAARPRDHGSGLMSGWATVGRRPLGGCADDAQAPAEPWAPAQHRGGPQPPAAAPPGPRPARPPGPCPPAAGGPPRPAPPAPPPAAAPSGGPRPDDAPPAKRQEQKVIFPSKQSNFQDPTKPQSSQLPENLTSD